MKHEHSRLFASLALTTVVLTIGLIVFGAVVRVTDSGLGCGNDWPLCNGTIFPPLDNVTAWIEWLHRLFAALIGLFGLATLAIAIRAYRTRRRHVLVATSVAAVLFLIQSALGALVVVLELPPTMVTLHLGVAMLLVGALLVALLLVAYRPTVKTPRDRFSTLAYVTTALSLVIILTGALVRGRGATLACIDWPLCNGAIIPLGQGELALVHMLHRYAVVGLGIALGLLVWLAFTQRPAPIVRNLAVASLVVYLMQAGVGALYVFSAAAPLWGAAHVMLAAMTWALLVSLSVIETMNSQDLTGETIPVWQPQSDAVAN